MTIAPTSRLTLRSIRVRAALLTSALIAVVLVAVIAYTYWALHTNLLRAGEERAARVAAQLAAILGPPIPERLAEFQRLVDDDGVRRAILDPSTDAENAAFERLKSIAGTAAQPHAMELWNAAGTRIWSRRLPETGNTVPLSDRAPEQTGVLPYRLIGDAIYLDLVAPVRSAGGSTVGHVVARRLATNPNSPTTLNRLVGEGGHALVANQSGTLWTDLANPVPAPPIDVRRQGLHRYTGPDSTNYIGAVAHLPGTPLALFVAFPESFFVAPAGTLLRQLTLVGVVFIVLAVVIVWHISARVTEPLDNLTHALETLSAGDFSRRVDASTGSEVGRLGAAFNLMATKIESGLRDVKEKDQRKAAMMNAALDCIVTTDLSGRITEFNPAAERLFDYSRSDLPGLELGMLLGLPQFRDYRDLDDYVQRAGTLRLTTRQEWTAQRADGTTFTAEAVVVPIREGQLAFAAFIRDLTDQKAAESALLRSIVLEEENRRVQEASRLKSEFLANMSHELRTPLNAIIGFAELLYDGQVTPDMPQFKDFMHDILTSGQHLLQLINDVLDLSKVEAGRLEFHPEDTSLEQVVTETLSVVRTLAAQKQLSLASEIDPTIRQAFIDRGRLKQVLYNYVSNAIKFTPEGGKVAIRIAPEGGDDFRIEVSDTGIGISAADLQRLFVEFNQLEAGAAKKHQGTGLGLALTRRLVEAQGGRVGVGSTLGQGATFFAILPRRATKGTPLANPRTILSNRIGAPSVLVIEDEPRDQDAIVNILIDAGFNVETANSRAQAITKLSAHTFDAITLDLILPDANGADLLRDIRAGERNRDVPVVVITIVAESGAVSGFAVHDILSKPVDGATVIASLRRAGVAAGGAGTVLVVDDDAGSLRLMAASLQQLGFRSTCVARAIEGLRISEREAPLAVVLDLQMPEMDGFGFLDHFRRMPHCEHVPVIVWTVKDLSPAHFARLKSTVQGVLSKGQSGRSVVEELRRFVVERQA